MDAVARIVRVAAYGAASILVIWILLYLLDANRTNDVVRWFQDAADWLATWSRNLFSIDDDKLRATVNYGAAAAVYALVGALATRTTRRG
jgi:hypothetical protein